MDAKQVWVGSFFKLDAVSEFLHELDGPRSSRPKVHELFVTWVVAKFLQSVKKSEHLIGFPSIQSREGRKLVDFVFGHEALDSDNFDTVIIDSKSPKVPMRIQVKRYVNSTDPTTEGFAQFLINKSRRYGNAPEVNMVFHIQQGLALDLRKLSDALRDQPIHVGTIWIFSEPRAMKERCFLFQVHPEFTGELWYPDHETE